MSDRFESSQFTVDTVAVCRGALFVRHDAILT